YIVGSSIDPVGLADYHRINEMILVALLIAPAVVSMSVVSGDPSPWRFLIAAASLAVIVAVVVVSSRRGNTIGDEPDEPSAVPAGAPTTAVTSGATDGAEQVDDGEAVTRARRG